eukprot:3824328-Lingulodinium_polyedra.AAC.1
MLDPVDDRAGCTRQVLGANRGGHVPVAVMSEERLASQEWMHVDGLAERLGLGPRGRSDLQD